MIIQVSLEFPTMSDIRLALLKREQLKLGFFAIPHYAGFQIWMKGWVIIFPHDAIFLLLFFI